MPRRAGFLSHAASFVRIISALLALAAASMLLPALLAFFHGEAAVIPAFLWPMLAGLGITAPVLLRTRGQALSLSMKSGFATVALGWLFVGVLGAMPLFLTGAGFIDALFESVSGFTTTGATVFPDVSVFPASVNLWRCQTHWLGGMGIVALTVAILPLVGGSGFQLIKVETTGPEKGKITPKIAETAKILWLFYLGLTAAQFLLLCAFGMNFTDALAHAFSTMGTGGFSTKTEGIAFYRSAGIETVCMVFMFLATVNFSLYYSLYSRRFREIANNSELRAFCVIVAASGLIITLVILGEKQSFFTAARFAFFQTLSVISTTGFVTDDFSLWPPAAQMCLFFLMCVGGCSGSTAGGIKVIRWVILGKQTARECRRTLHPQGVFTLRINDKVVSGSFVLSAAAFIAFYLMFALALALAVSAIDRVDGVTSLTSALSMLGNIGPAFGRGGLVADFARFSGASKLLYCLAMLVGRLELYAVLLFFFPAFWRRD
jgi:trk system potassium uptake protein TrkH